MGIGSSSVMITSEPLMGSSNYLAWASSVELWCKGQGVQDHLTKKACVVDENAKSSAEDATVKAQWENIDAQLCCLLWRSIDSKLMPLFHPFQTCYLGWEKARALYTNDISHLYDVISRMTNLKKQESNMSTYLGQVQAVMEEFETLMPVTTDVEKQQEHRQMLFLVFTLVGLPNDYDSVCVKILASPTTPTIDELFSRLLHLATPPNHKGVSSSTVDSSDFASQTIEKQTY
uniref:Integrase core domain containing protein n=1 Tax=Solanum tuberosum TaxID=4113 RepID=M1CE28_SOLTU